MRECFHPDSLIRVSWFSGNGAEFVAGSIDMPQKGMSAKRRLGPALVRLSGNRGAATQGRSLDEICADALCDTPLVPQPLTGKTRRHAVAASSTPTHTRIPGWQGSEALRRTDGGALFHLTLLDWQSESHAVRFFLHHRAAAPVGTEAAEHCDASFESLEPVRPCMSSAQFWIH